ncbi:MAG TPA: carboxypeptidase regulatory-like domain-containing protein [Terriglobales bacterium]|nr:carboxypeptidase regulatory-like domain-containing protein [Terriglobales bacterium]
MKTFALVFFMMTVAGMAQSLTTGALSGNITDPSGASIPGAKVTATSAATGAVHSTESQANGGYLIPLLEPGQYTITVEKTGFQTAKQSGVGIAVSTTGALNFKLQVGASSQTVEVTGEAPLIQPQNANTTTTLDSKAIENLPNPGGDITMLAQISPGAVMHVQGGGGTAGLSFNGVQGNAIEYTYDGMDDNDPFNNDNNSGPSNMLLGQNSVSEVTVNTNAYAVDQGRMAAGQVNYSSKSGSNNFHGDLSWQWNGRVLNAHDFFDKSTPGVPVLAKPFDNVNNWTGGIGGPIVKNKLFFFFDSEGTRIDLPLQTTFTVPTPAYIAFAESQIATGGWDPNPALKDANGFKPLPGQPAEAAFQKSFFSLFGDTSVGTRNGSQISPSTKALLGCPILANGTLDPNYAPGPNGTFPNDTGCSNKGVFNGTAKTPETLTDVRIDYNLNANNTVWGKFLNDQGTQTTGISPINPVFDENSFQPDRQGVLDWTHIFSPTLTNDASTGFLWYGAIFDFDTPAAEHAAVDGLGSIGSPFSTLGSTNFPQGRNVTQYQAIDNLTWTHGDHSIKIGENFRRELVNDHNFARSFASSNTSNVLEAAFAAASSATQRYPITTVEQFKDFSLDVYAGDTWQLNRNLTLTYGLRATHNSNPIDRQAFIGNFADFTTFTHPNLNGGNLATPPNAVFQASNKLWNSVDFAVWQPRLALAWQPRTSTLIKAGWGMFSQVAATSAADTLANNPPFNPSFTGGFSPGNLGANGSPAGCTQAGGSNPQCGFLWDPTLPGSAVLAAVAGNAGFQKNFTGGAPSCAFTGPSTTCVPPANIAALPAQGLLSPIVYQYNLTAQQQLGRNLSVSLGYVGTRSQHNSYSYNDNGFEKVCAGCFAPFLFAKNSAGSPDPRFLSYTQTRYDGYGRYDSLQAGLVDRLSHGLTLNFNYTWSHCLTTGTPYQDGAGSSLRNVYDDCSSDIQQVANASYTYALPIHVGNAFAGKVVNGWQISGATWAEGGTPLFITMDGGGSLGGVLVQTSGPRGGLLASGVSPYAKNTFINGVTNPGSVQWLNPSALLTFYDPNTGKCMAPGTTTEVAPSPAACQFFGNNGTTLRGPTFQWTNFDLSKSTQLTEHVNLRLDFQAYNLFNHPNFANPDRTAAAGTADMAGSDAITSLTSPNNGLLGQNGGDSAPRMLAFQAKIVF